MELDYQLLWRNGSLENIEGKPVISTHPSSVPTSTKISPKGPMKTSSPYEVIEISKTTYLKKPQSSRLQGSPALKRTGERVKSHVYQNSAVEKLEKNSDDYDTLNA